MCPINLNTPIEELKIPYWDMILEEKFLIHPIFPLDRQLRTVGDLLVLCQWNETELIDHLKWLTNVSPLLPIRKEELTSFHLSHPNAVILDINLKPGDQNHGSFPYLILRNFDFEDFLDTNRDTPILVQAETSERGASACLYLLEEGVKLVRFLS